VPAYGLVDRLPVIDAVSHETAYLPINLIQKVRHLGRVLFASLSQLGSHYPAVVVHSNVQFLPTLTPLLSVFPGVPFSLTAYLETSAIYDETHGAIWEFIDFSLYIHCLVPAGQGRVIRTWEIQSHQSEYGSEESLCLAQWKMKDQPQRQ
jgi:hypothetical protein